MDETNIDNDENINPLENLTEDGLAALFHSFRAMIGGTPPPLVEAIRTNDRDAVTQLLDEGADPFQTYGIDQRTAFHEASARKDVELMMILAAEPGSPWTKQYLISKGHMVDAPSNGRPCISIATSSSGNFFFDSKLTSLEGLEVMMSFGYKLKKRDYEYSILPLSFQTGDTRILKLGITSLRMDEVGLEQCLGMAIGGRHPSFINGVHPTSIAIARILLRLGADPNGYCFQGETPYDFIPALYQAIENKDKEMTKLLVSYGADVAKEAQYSSWTDEDTLDIDSKTILEKAEEAQMTDLLVPETMFHPDPTSFINDCRQELEAPLKRILAENISLLVVAMMRTLGFAPPVGIVSDLVLSYSPLGFGLWPIRKP